MTFSSLESELRIRFVNRRMPLRKYILLTEWLNCFQYIIPEDRELIYFPYPIPVQKTYNSHDYYKTACWLSIVETYLTTEEQKCLLRLISGYET